MASKLLIDDYPIQVLPKLAIEIGLNEAIILQQIHYWLNQSKHFYDGKKWIYNTYEDWNEQFPFWSVMTIRRTITSLEKQNLIISANYNKAGFDKTRWYSIDYEEVESVNRRCVQNEQTICSKRTDGSVQNEQTNTRDYTETSSETTNNSATNVASELENQLTKEFEDWYNLYNKKKDRKAAFTKFKTARKKHSYEEIVKGTKEYLKTITDKQYQKHPKTFLHNESYLDDYSDDIKKSNDTKTSDEVMFEELL
ncbi:hypothetical protein RM614_07795 [Mammaliicoccus sciuri]|uniref:hypothetical protein n=1 Tax=Mammaliicoccus sciuri TaxID=1296 RepID=UPI002884CB43|nr:hypothetical protein [Mammaliicoccus sciuri]MDT0711042.1 hypothetical protein [Mammaliicoccus sciuri]